MVTTPVDELRSAAVLLRQRAEAAPKGPWSVEYFGDRGYPQRITNAQATLIANTYEGGSGLRTIPEYIRLMHPLVGLALADALDQAAGDFGNGTDLGFQKLMLEASQHGPEHPLLVAARLILGGGS